MKGNAEGTFIVYADYLNKSVTPVLGERASSILFALSTGIIKCGCVGDYDSSYKYCVDSVNFVKSLGCLYCWNKYLVKSITIKELLTRVHDAVYNQLKNLKANFKIEKVALDSIAGRKISVSVDVTYVKKGIQLVTEGISNIVQDLVSPNVYTTVNVKEREDKKVDIHAEEYQGQLVSVLNMNTVEGLFQRRNLSLSSILDKLKYHDECTKLLKWDNPEYNSLNRDRCTLKGRL